MLHKDSSIFKDVMKQGGHQRLPLGLAHGQVTVEIALEQFVKGSVRIMSHINHHILIPGHKVCGQAFGQNRFVVLKECAIVRGCVGIRSSRGGGCGFLGCRVSLEVIQRSGDGCVDKVFQTRHRSSRIEIVGIAFLRHALLRRIDLLVISFISRRSRRRRRC